MRVHLSRHTYLDSAVLGVLTAGELELHTLEPPWRHNEHNVSCIPLGEYGLWPYVWAQHGLVYFVPDVPGRTDILIHSGNVPEHTKGCILVGLEQAGTLARPELVMSLAALKRLREVLGPTEHHTLSVEHFNPYSV